MSLLAPAFGPAHAETRQGSRRGHFTPRYVGFADGRIERRAPGQAAEAITVQTARGILATYERGIERLGSGSTGAGTAAMFAYAADLRAAIAAAAFRSAGAVS